MSPRSSSRSSKPASIAKSSSSSGQLLLLDLLDGDLEGRLAAGQLLGCRNRPGMSARAYASRPRRRRGSRPRSPGSGCREPSSTSWSRPSPPANGSSSRLLAELRVLDRQRADVVDHDEVPVSRPGARPSPGVPGARASPSISCSRRASSARGSSPRHLEPLVGSELGLRQHTDLDRELERLALWAAARRDPASGPPRGRSPTPRSRPSTSWRACRGRLPRGPPRGPCAGSRAARAPCRGGSPGVSARGRAAAPCARGGPRSRRGNLDLQAHAGVPQLGEGGLQAAGTPATIPCRACAPAPTPRSLRRAEARMLDRCRRAPARRRRSTCWRRASAHLARRRAGGRTPRARDPAPRPALAIGCAD